MSELFQTLIDERKEEVASYKEMLEKYAGLVIQVENPKQNNSHPESIRTSLALCALYDNFGEDEEYTFISKASSCQCCCVCTSLNEPEVHRKFCASEFWLDKKTAGKICKSAKNDSPSICKR